MSVVLIALAIFVSALIALLVIPVWFIVGVEWRGTLRSSWRLRWLCGFVEIGSDRRPSRPGKSSRPEISTARDRQRVDRPMSSGRGGKMALAAFRTRGLLRRALRLITDLLQRVQCERLWLEAEFGFADPADTGRLYGALSPLLAAAAVKGFKVRCQPNFIGSGLDGAGEAVLHFRPVSIIWTLMVFVFSPPVWRAAWAVWRARK